jgi:hypothetical protein
MDISSFGCEVFSALAAAFVLFAVKFCFGGGGEFSGKIDFSG